MPAPVDVIDIFRASDAALAVTREAIALKDKLGLKVLWMQLGVRNDEAAAEAEAAGLKVVMNRCPKIEYGRLSGEIGWAGVNSGTISSVRPKLAAHGVQSHVLAGKRSELGAGDAAGREFEVDEQQADGTHAERQSGERRGNRP